MKSFSKSLLLSLVTFAVTSNVAFANVCTPGQTGCAVPEPGSLALIGLGVVAAVAAVRKAKK